MSERSDLERRLIGHARGTLNREDEAVMIEAAAAIAVLREIVEAQDGVLVAYRLGRQAPGKARGRAAAQGGIPRRAGAGGEGRDRCLS